MKKSEIRKDYFLDKYVIIAPKRAKRPMAASKSDSKDKKCFFCPDNLANDEVITYTHKKSYGDWNILAIQNRFPALSPDNPRAYGFQEVIIESRKHDFQINDFSEEHIIDVFNAYVDRFNELISSDQVKHVIVFKNEGGKAGASMTHSHSQVIALPLLPPKVEEEITAYDKYRLENGSCPFCDVIKKEQNGQRAIFEDDNIFVVAPFASDSPYGAWFIPKRHVKYFSELNYSEKQSLAKAFKLVLGKLDELGISYNYFVENAVNAQDYHTHIKLSPRPNIWAGLELGTGVIINPIPPEFATKVYRNEIKIEANPDHPDHIKL